MLKEAIKRRKPDFSESYYGFRAFGNLLEEAQARGLLEIGRDEKSGTYVFRSNGMVARPEALTEVVAEPLPVVPPPSEPSEPEAATTEETSEPAAARRKSESRRKATEKGTKRVRQPRAAKPEEVPIDAVETGSTECVVPPEVAPAERVESVQEVAAAPAGEKVPVPAEAGQAGIPVAEKGLVEEMTAAVPAADDAQDHAVKKPATRSRRPRKPKVLPETV